MTTRAFGACAGLFVAASLAIGQTKDPAAAVRAAELARFEAQVKRDTAALDRLLADELRYVHSSALVETKQHFIETVATGRIVYDSMVPVEMHHRVYGETAVGSGEVRVQVEMDGKTLRVSLLFTTVHVRQHGRWRLVAWQSTRIS